MKKLIVKHGVKKKVARKKVAKQIVQKKTIVVKKKKTPEDKKFSEAYEMLMEYHEGYKVDLEKGGCCNED